MEAVSDSAELVRCRTDTGNRFSRLVITVRGEDLALYEACGRPTIQKFQFFPGDVDYTTLKGRMAIQRSEGIVSDKPSSYELLVRMAETALLHMRDEGFHRLVAYVKDAGNKRLEFTPFAGSDSYMDAQRAVRDATLSLAGVPPSGPCLELRHIIAAENVVWKRAYLKKRAHGAQHLAADLLLF